MRRDAALVGIVVGLAVVELDLLPAPLAQMVDAQVDDDAIEPREELSVALERCKVLVDLEEGFLADIARVVGVMNHPERDGEGTALVSGNQLGKGRRVPAARIFHELPVVRLQARLRFVGSQVIDDAPGPIIQRKMRRKPAKKENGRPEPPALGGVGRKLGRPTVSMYFFDEHCNLIFRAFFVTR